MQDAEAQTEEGGEQQKGEWADPALLEAARLEIERLKDLSSGLLESHAAAQQELHDALELHRSAQLARDRESAARQAAEVEHQVALDAAQRAEAGLRQRLAMAERQLAHQGGEVQALREANDKLELALGELKVQLGPLLPLRQG